MWRIILCSGLLHVSTLAVKYDCDGYVKGEREVVSSHRQKDKCYIGDMVKNTFDVMKERCASLYGGRLAVADTIDYYNDLLHFAITMKEKFCSGVCFIGFRQTVWGDPEPLRNNWFWFNGHPVMMNASLWGGNQPDGGLNPNLSPQACGCIWPPGPWPHGGDTSCTLSQNAVCEAPTYKPSEIEVASTATRFDNPPLPGARPARIYTQEVADILADYLPSNPGYAVLTALGQDPIDSQLKWLTSATGGTDTGSSLDIRPKIKGVDALPTKFVFFSRDTKGFTNLADLSGISVLWSLEARSYQKFDRHTDGKRLNVVVTGSLMEMVTGMVDERGCAFKCTAIEGCLSFNHKLSDNNCELLALKSDATTSTPVMANWVDDPDYVYYQRVY